MTTILVATDLSHEALCAARWAVSLGTRLRHSGEEVHLLITHIVPVQALATRQVVSEQSEEGELQALRKELDDWAAELEVGEIEVRTEIHVGSAKRQIPELAKKRGAHWLVLGQTGKGRIAKIFLGTTAEQIALDPPCPTVLVKDESFPWEGPLKIFSTLDLRPPSFQAAKKAAELFADQLPEITFAHVVDLPKMGSGLIDSNTLPETISTYLDESTRAIRADIEETWKKLSPSPKLKPKIELRPGYPTHELSYLIDEAAPDLLTMGVNKHSALSRFFLGSVGHGVIRQGPATCLLYPYDDEESDS